MTALKKASYATLLLSVTTPFLYERYTAFAPLLANRAGAFTPVQNPSPSAAAFSFEDAQIAFSDELKNCEDVVMIEKEGVALLSCDEGRDRWNTVMGTFRRDLHIPNGTLYIYDYTTPPSSPTTSSSSKLQSITLSNFDSAESFHPLGVEYDEKTSTLYVVNHAFSGACIEIFSLDLATAAATHRQTIKHPLLHAPNSIHSLGEGKLYVTNDHHFHASVYPILSKIETFSGAPGGTVMYVDTRDVNNTVKIVARVPFANGIVMLNSSTLAVSSTSKPGVYFFDVSASDYSLHLRNVVSAPASVDNLNVDSNGALLLAGHPDPFRITQLSKKRWACVRGSQDEKEREACGCEAPSWVGEWTQEQGLTTLSLTEGFCSSTTFARDVGRGVGIVSGLYADGLLEVRS